METALHLFTSCQRVQDIWPPLVVALLPFSGPPADETLLYLAWPPGNFQKNFIEFYDKKKIICTSTNDYRSF
jgi:hypothetical protein